MQVERPRQRFGIAERPQEQGRHIVGPESVSPRPGKRGGEAKRGSPEAERPPRNFGKDCAIAPISGGVTIRELKLWALSPTPALGSDAWLP